MNFLKRYFFTAALFACTHYLSAQAGFPSSQLTGQANGITTAAPFLLIAPDARAGAMGETGVASSPDVNSIHWNVAKLAFAEKKAALGISYTPWLRALLPDINLEYVSFYFKPDTNAAITGAMRYFSMGNVTVTSAAGTIGQYRPNEFAIDLGYSRRIANYWSVGITGRYIRSNLGAGVVGSSAGNSLAADLGVYYCNRDRVKLFNRPTVLLFGAALTNAGSKMHYTASDAKDFLPANLRIGQGMQVQLNADHKLSLQYEFNKLLVPTPPVYALDSNGRPVQNSSGQYVIVAGKDANVSVPRGMLQSFGDAPGGAKEEFAEISFAAGAEYVYHTILAARAGYFYEAKTKGNRQFLTLGAGIKYDIIGLDFAYLIPVNGQRSPLQNTVRFSLLFDFGNVKKKN